MYCEHMSVVISQLFACIGNVYYANIFVFVYDTQYGDCANSTVEKNST